MTRPGPGLVDTVAVASDLIVAGRTAAVLDQISPGAVSVRLPGSEEDLAAAAEALRAFGWHVDEPGGWLLITRDEEPFSAGYWHAVDTAGRRPRGGTALALALGCLAGAGFATWSAWTGYNPLWWRVTSLAGVAAVFGWLGFRRRRPGPGQTRFWPLAVSFPDDYQADRHLAGTNTQFNYASPKERREAAARWRQAGCTPVSRRPFTTDSNPMEVL